jgi:preprotein translocase subunit SecE
MGMKMGTKGKASGPGDRSGVQRLAHEVVQELRRVVWPTGRQTLGYTGWVIFAVVVISLLTVLFDALFGFAIGKIVS